MPNRQRHRVVRTSARVHERRVGEVRVWQHFMSICYDACTNSFLSQKCGRPIRSKFRAVLGACAHRIVRVGRVDLALFDGGIHRVSSGLPYQHRRILLTIVAAECVVNDATLLEGRTGADQHRTRYRQHGWA